MGRFGLSSVAAKMDSKKTIKVMKVEEGEAGKARKLVEEIMEELVVGAMGEGGGNGKGKSKSMKKGERGESIEIEFVGV